MRGINIISFHCYLLSLNVWNAYIKERREYILSSPRRASASSGASFIVRRARYFIGL
jgi:hypothetical protein